MLNIRQFKANFYHDKMMNFIRFFLSDLKLGIFLQNWEKRYFLALGI